MTSAEFKTAREALRLDQPHLAELLGVSYVTVRRWESRGHIPPGVAPEIAAIRQAVETRIAETLEAVDGVTRRAGGPPADAHLVRYRSPDQAERHLGDRQAALLHIAIVTGVYEALRASGIQVRLVMMDEDAYESWREAEDLADDEAARAAWAGLQVG